MAKTGPKVSSPHALPDPRVAPNPSCECGAVFRLHSRGAMKRSYWWCVLTSILVFAVMSEPATGLAKNNDKEKMMWRGFILMEAIEKHEYDIEPSEDLDWRHGMKKRYKSQVATAQVISADPLGSGETRLSGRVQVEMQDHETFGVRPPPTWCTHGWVLNQDTQKANASTMLQDNQVRITFARKSHVDAATAIQQAIERCGANPDCLAKVYDQFKGVIDDPSPSFPIKMVVQCRPSCRDVIQTHSLRKRGRYCRNEETTERDDSRDITTELCLPMNFEMDGMYSRGEKGDTITAFFQDSGNSPHKAFDGEDHPVNRQTRCTVNLTNGPPEVRIYRLTDDAPPKDITDQEEKVLVGEMLRLQACVVGTGLGEESDRKWDIPDETIKNWEADRDAGPTRKDLEEKDLKKGIIRFACVDGEPGGKHKTVTFHAVYGTAELKGETRLKVYEPKVENVEFEFGDYVGIGKRLDGGCNLEPAKGDKSLGIRWKSRVTMPSDFESRAQCVQMVQVFSGNNWFLQRVGFPFYMWAVQYEVGILDTSYPFCGPACGGKETVIEMRDNPCAPLSLMASAYVHERFEAYLMFRPGAVLDVHSVWVPLKRVDWAWKGAVVDQNPYDGKIKACDTSYALIGGCIQPPSSYDPRVQDTILYPEWKGCYNKTNEKPKLTTMETQDPKTRPPAQAGWTCP